MIETALLESGAKHSKDYTYFDLLALANPFVKEMFCGENTSIYESIWDETMRKKIKKSYIPVKADVTESGGPKIISNQEIALLGVQSLFGALLNK